MTMSPMQLSLGTAKYILAFEIKYNICTDVCNFNCRDGLGKLQNLSENPPLEAPACQEDQLKVSFLMRQTIIVRRMKMLRRLFSW